MAEAKETEKAGKAENAEEAEKAEVVPAMRSTAMPDWFDRWLGDWSWPRFWPDVRRAFPEGSEMLRVEEFTDDDGLVVRAEMPGIDPEKDVEIQVRDHVLRLRAERRQESKVEDKGGYRSEFHYGSFVRSVPLPAGATAKDVKATYTDGILEVRIPVDTKAAQATKIPIQRT
jgi:HSP20 family protein